MRPGCPLHNPSHCSSLPAISVSKAAFMAPSYTGGASGGGDPGGGSEQERHLAEQEQLWAWDSFALRREQEQVAPGHWVLEPCRSPAEGPPTLPGPSAACRGCTARCGLRGQAACFQSQLRCSLAATACKLLPLWARLCLRSGRNTAARSQTRLGDEPGAVSGSIWPTVSSK